jgi:peptidoglycan/xylan/chitin deacetylase (PgdA/CDA1 family)
MVNAVLAERYWRTVAEIARRGHEIVNHSYAMDVLPLLLDESAERENIRRTTELLASVAGTAPAGWISPRGTPSATTPRLLAEAGYRWYGDVFDDDLPSIMRFGEHAIVAIPLTMEVNDLPLAMRYGNPPGVMIEIFERTLERMRDHESDALMLDVTAHAHVFGRPAGAWAFDRILATLASAKDLWRPTRAEMAAYVRAQVAV